MSTKLIIRLSIVILLLTTYNRNRSIPAAIVVETPSPSQTSEPTADIKLELNACAGADEAVRIRNGLGTECEVIGALAPKACITIFARNQDSSWVSIETIEGFTGWVAAWLLNADGDITKVPVQDDIVLL